MERWLASFISAIQQETIPYDLERPVNNLKDIMENDMKKPMKVEILR